jgi:hypothetical protein
MPLAIRMAELVATAYIPAEGAAMPTTIRKTKAASPARKAKGAKARKTLTHASTVTVKPGREAAIGSAKTTHKAIFEAVKLYMAANYDSLILHAALASGPELDAIFAEIDRNLEASERITARLQAGQN